MALRLRTLLALGAFFVLAVGLTACGSGVPGDGVVRVDDAVIKKTTFEHWMGVAARSSQPPGATGQVKAPVPPDYTACVATKSKTAPKPAKGQPKPTTAQFKTQCKQEYEGLRDQVLQFLISAEWLAGEAKDQDLEVTDAEVKKEFDRQKKQSFPKEADFQRFLKTSGMSMEDLLFQVRTDRLSNKIREKITKGKSKVSNAQITAYYEKNKARFAQPERRDLQVVLTKSEARADQARSDLQGGKSFASVAKEYSVDQASKAQGGKLPAVTKGQQEKALEEAAFTAKRGQLEGPVKTQFGYYVFKVTKVTPPSQQSLAQARPTIRQLLASQNQQKALNKFSKEFQEKWKERTNCRKGFIVETCKNAPKKKAGQQVPPGAAPQGGQQQAPPPQSGQQQAPPPQSGQQQAPPQP